MLQRVRLVAGSIPWKGSHWLPKPHRCYKKSLMIFKRCTNPNVSNYCWNFLITYRNLPNAMLAMKMRWNRSLSVRRSEEHTSELQSRFDLVCRLLLEKKKADDSDGGT